MVAGLTAWHATAPATITLGAHECIGSLAQPAVLVDARSAASTLDVVFRRSDDLRCVVMTGLDGPVLIDRGWFERLMTGPIGYGRVLHSRRTLADLRPPSCLVFAADEPVTRAAAAIIGRTDPRTTFDAVVVRHPDGALGVVDVATVLERLAHHYAYQSVHDPLTGLPNRLMLMQQLQAALVTGRPSVLLYVDLDRFKDVNDAYGHAAGDQLLVQFADRLRDQCREDDLVVRLGGDEFAVLAAPGSPMAAAASMAERIVRAAARSFSVMGLVEGDGAPQQREVVVGASVGIASSGTTSSGPDVVLKHADSAMYQAKSRGRGRVARFDERNDSVELARELHGRRLMERRLRQAIADRTLTLHYQPVVALPEGRVVGAEALARWHDEELGAVAPDRFIAVAEAGGLIIDLGRWVLDTACREAASWGSADGVSGPSVSVNVSPVQLAEPGFVDDVRASLAVSGLAAARLCLEVTETAAIGDLTATAQTLEELRGLGLRIALDDFGTGHSSLTLLKQLPFDVVKIDRSFVRDVTRSAQDAALVRLVIDAAHSLGRRVCAEGIEDDQQARQLAAMGCDSAQGWFFGMPEPAGRRLRATLTSQGTIEAIDLAAPPPMALAGTDELVIVASPDGLITYASSTATALLGRTPSALVGSSLSALLHPDDTGLMAGVELSGQPMTRTHRVLRADGTVRWVRTDAQLLSGSTGAGTEVLLVSRDVTDLMGLREALVVSEDRFRHAFDDAPIGMAITTLDGDFVRVNHEFARLVGRDRDDLMSLTVDQLTPPAFQAVDAVNLAALADGREQVQDVDKEYLHHDGSRVPVRLRASVIGAGPGRPELVIAHVLPRPADPAAGAGAAGPDRLDIPRLRAVKQRPVLRC